MPMARWRAPTPSIMPTDTHIAWIAGLVEGEGSYYLKNGRYPQAIFQLNMADEDVVRNAHRLSGNLGTVTPHDPGAKGVKQQWRWRISAAAEVAYFMKMMRPWMGERRTAKIDELWDVIPDWAKEGLQ